MYQSFQDAAKAELKWKFMALKIQISDKEKPKIIAISIHLQVLEKELQNKFHFSRQKKTKVREKIYGTKKKHKREQSSPLERLKNSKQLIKKKREINTIKTKFQVLLMLRNNRILRKMFRKNFVQIKFTT